MGKVYLSTDLFSPPAGAVEQGYALGSGPVYTPTLMFAGGLQATFVCAPPSHTTFVYGGNFYRLLNRQIAAISSPMMKSADGVTWAVLDGANSPARMTCAGFFDGDHTVLCAFIDSLAGVSGVIKLRNFDLATETWGAVYGVAGGPTGQNNSVISIYKRLNNTLLVLFDNRIAASPLLSGLGAASYDLTGAAWNAAYDIGANMLLLAGWDATQTSIKTGQFTNAMDATGRVHCFWSTSSLQFVPVIWGNRCFYQAIKPDDTLGSFKDFPGQVAPLTGGKQDLVSFTGSPLGTPIIVQDKIVLPVLNTNRSVIDPFPHELANVYVGTPLSAPVWTKDVTKTIDPGALVNDLIYPQESPFMFFDNVSMYAVFIAQDDDGTNLYRLRLCISDNLTSPADGWRAVTAMDVQVIGPPLDFAGQALVGPAIFAPAKAALTRINAVNYPSITLPDPTREC